MVSNKHRFIKNLSLLYLATVISKAFALIINIILIRRLGASIYGAYGFALTFVTYFIFIADSGLSPYGETAISKDKENVARITEDIFSFNLAASIFSTILMLVFILFIFKFRQIQINILLLFSVLPLFDSFAFNYTVKALEKNYILAISSFSGRLIYLIGVLIFAINGKDYLFAALFYITGVFITAVIQFGFVKRIIGKIKLNFSFKNFKHLALNALPLGLVSGFVIVYTSLPVVFLKILSSDKNIGFYYITNRLVIFVFMLFTLMAGAFIPIISEAVKNKDLNKQVSILSELLRFEYTFSLPICFGGFAISKLIISRFFGSSYILSAYLLQIMVWSVFFVGISSVFSGYLISINDRKSLISAAFITTLAGLAVSPLLIEFYGVYGSAWANLLIEFTMALFLIIFTLKKSDIYKGIKLNIDKLNLFKVLLFSAIMGLTVRILIYSLNFGLGLSIISGIFIYGFLSLLFKTLKSQDVEELKAVIFKSNK